MARFRIFTQFIPDMKQWCAFVEDSLLKFNLRDFKKHIALLDREFTSKDKLNHIDYLCSYVVVPQYDNEKEKAIAMVESLLTDKIRDLIASLPDDLNYVFSED